MGYFNIKEAFGNIKKKKVLLNSFGSLPKETIKSFRDWLKIELTYTSNAIEGNTLSRQETMLVVEEDLSVPGKSAREILEVKNHHKALDFVLDIAKTKKGVKDITQRDILDIHNCILAGIDNYNAGKYRSVQVRIAGSQHIPPNYAKVSDLMDELEMGLKKVNTSDPIKVACDFHFKFVSIHPFVDGNGRTARLLFNLVLLIYGFPLSFIEKQERSKYLQSLEKANIKDDFNDYYELMYGSVIRSLDLYLSQFQEKQQQQSISEELFMVGQIAKMTQETESTIRYWTKNKLLPVIRGKNGYAYYDFRSVSLCKKIRQLQNERRFTLDEIKQILNP